MHIFSCFCKFSTIRNGQAEKHLCFLSKEQNENRQLDAMAAMGVSKAHLYIDKQSAGISTTLEAVDEIDDIPINSVALVRMLGIILDNAIEELTVLGKGQFMIACYKFGGGLTSIVQNTCRPDIQKLYTLKQAGFSTKGEGRGLGLSNLTEIVESHSSNITLQTSIADGNFTQRLRIGGGITS